MNIIWIAALALTFATSTSQAQSPKKKISIQAALDDLSVELTPDFPPLSKVFIRNANTARSVVASVRVTGEKSFKVQSLTRTTTREVFPQYCEVRVPPGQRKLVGFDNISHTLAHFPGRTEFIKTRHVITGARYIADEPVPLPNPREILESVFVYDVAVGGGVPFSTLFLNLNCVFGIDFELQAGRDLIAGALLPLETKVLYAGPSVSFNVVRANYFVPY